MMMMVTKILTSNDNSVKLQTHSSLVIKIYFNPVLPRNIFPQFLFT